MSDLNITPSNFEEGITCIAVSTHQEKELQAYIDTFEKIYLQDLLGCELYDLFIADLTNGVPTTQIYIDIFNSFAKDKRSYNIQLRSEGLVKMVEKFIYWEYVRKQKVKNTPSGNIINDNEASKQASIPQSDLYINYNNGIVSYWAIQSFICENLNDYPTFNGIKKDKTSWI